MSDKWKPIIIIAILTIVIYTGIINTDVILSIFGRLFNGIKPIIELLLIFSSLFIAYKMFSGKGRKK